MTLEDLVQHVINGETLTESQIHTLEVNVIGRLVEDLKAAADRHWRIDPNISLKCAEAIIQIGQTTGNRSTVGLGLMARGDALRNLQQTEKAWVTLANAGEVYLEAGDKVGWSRTRIGRMAICVPMNAIESALQDADAARQIFLEHGEIDKLIRLESNVARIFSQLNQFHEAVAQYQEVLRLVETLPEVDTHRLVIIYDNLGYAYQGLGDLQNALYWYTKNRELMLAKGELLGIALADLNIINILYALGHYKKALLLLYKTVEALEQNQSIERITDTWWHLIECYMFFNRYAEARSLARKIIQQYAPDRENLTLAQSLLQLAAAELAHNNFVKTFEALDRAEIIFGGLNADAWLGLVFLYRGQAALRGNDVATARRAADRATTFFIQHNQRLCHLMAVILSVEIEVADTQFEAALHKAQDAQNLARTLQVPHLRYAIHLLLGKIAEQTGNLHRAMRQYQVATRLMERMRRSLVLTSRAEFLADKQDAVKSLLRLHLAAGRDEAAFEALERAKAQVWLGYLSQLDHLRWLPDAPHTRPLIDELSRLREEHHRYYRMAHDQVFRQQQPGTISPQQAALEASNREQQLRVLTEQLYLHSSADDMAATTPVSMSDIQAALAGDTLMVAYYSDGDCFHVFLLDSDGMQICSLGESTTEVDRLVQKLQSNINRVLRTAPDSDEARTLHGYSQQLTQQLYDALIRPFESRLEHYRQLVIVPYGSLHYLPFHLLHDSSAYLIERFEVGILPTGSLIVRQPPRRKREARALAYSWDGRLHHSVEEAQQVVKRFGGNWHSEAGASQSVFSEMPCQVLHISAHGQYRMDQPEFSYIQLADGPLYTDDLFQYDLSYELVTLSACETGRSYAAAGDELIGLGRGFLFAGAGALIASLWRVDDALTLELMETLYEQLDNGASKAAALRTAQITLMRAYPGMHPAFWGAFELIGNPDPLTQHPETN